MATATNGSRLFTLINMRLFFNWTKGLI